MSRLLAILTLETGLTGHDLSRIIASAPRRYKEFKMPKRQGGFRHMAQPAREVKALQRALVKHYLEKLPIHSSAMAYERGTSIRLNAERHAKVNGPILKLDFRDFFPSIRPSDWIAYATRHNIFDTEYELLASAKILFYRKKGSTTHRLAIGAPSSPKVSNLIMYDFDLKVGESLAHDRVVYTRYADDLTFSAPRTGYLNAVEKTVRQILKKLPYPRLTLNDDKRVMATRKFHRQVTGLVITNDGNVSLGRERKRSLRAALHSFQRGKLDREKSRHLFGMMAFAKDVEPEFYARMEARYGNPVMEALAAMLIEAVIPDLPTE